MQIGAASCRPFQFCGVVYSQVSENGKAVISQIEIGMMGYMRVLVVVFVALAGVARAAPDCAEPAEIQGQGALAYDPTAALEVISEQEAAPTVVRDVTRSLRPKLRPCWLRQLELGREKMRTRGAVCGDWTIIGEVRQPIRGERQGCGITAPVSIRNVSGILLSQFAVMDCETAVTLKTWLENTAKPAFADRGGGLKGLRVAGHYACKTRNNQPDKPLSEHAKGRAIDISSFVLIDGTVITVREGWTDEKTHELMRELHAGACGLFGTVLGPDADSYHAGHLHFDTASRPSGPYCR